MYAVIDPCTKIFPGNREECELDQNNWNYVVGRTNLNALWRNNYFDFSEFKESPIKQFYEN